ncbi:MAG: FGGY-family carbohydrate kinase [Clostridiales bacterium]|nr:FGGY-family carbohydrate kinase [Clostridiales bacterium]MBR6484281.1 FGGY-family carbohydrate kinase [Clostridiales bacterium]
MEFKNTALGIELGSTRIKAVLIDKDHIPVASGEFEWENKLVDGIWTYSTDLIHEGIRGCFASLKEDVFKRYGKKLDTVGAIGISAMMHGYLPFDKDGTQLAGFRTWRNTITGEAAEKLTDLFGFNIPQRWSIAHLYQAYLNKEDHVKDIDFLTTLAGYIHRRLTGEKVMGVGEASGMFPIDSDTCDYREDLIAKFDALTGMDLRNILPRVLSAGEYAGVLTSEGALFLDPTGDLKPGIPVAPCEGDAGTGMVATDSVRVRTGNVSAGTSDFAMIVVDHNLGVHREIDMVTTPDGAPVAMVHCNNCTSDINAWVNLFGEFGELMGIKADKGELFTKLFKIALEGDPDCGGLMSFNYFSGEGVTDLDEGRPVFLRTPDSSFTLANFMRTHLLSALATLKIGMDILQGTENVTIDKLYGHGGFFKTPEVGQKMLSAAVDAPVSVMETAGEGGPYGMALLAGYMLWKEEGETLPDYLDNNVFSDSKSTTIMADEKDVAGFRSFLTKYKDALKVEKTATEVY